jgi:hypothetical protein
MMTAKNSISGRPPLVDFINTIDPERPPARNTSYIACELLQRGVADGKLATNLERAAVALHVLHSGRKVCQFLETQSPR